MGWAIVKLGSICRIELGKTPSRSNKKFWDETKASNNVWLSIADLPLSLKPIMLDSKEYISNEGAKLCKVVPKNTLIVSFKLSLGRLAITGRDLYTNEAIAALYIQADAQIEQEYLYWYLSFFDWDDAAGSDIKVKGKTLNKAKLKEIDVPVPSISEQKRIVAILDQAFAHIEQARVKTEQNLKNARELFESYLQQVFSSRGEDWHETEVGNIVEVLTDYHANGSYKVLKQHVELKEEEDFAWMVRSTDFEKKFRNNKRYISESAYNYLKKSKLFGGEIIMSKIGNAGKVYLMPKIERPCSLAMNLFLLRLDSSKANNEYVFRYLNSSSGKAQIAPRLNGAATQTITKDNVRSLLIPLASLDKQEETINKLTQLEVEIERLEYLYLKKLRKIDDLKKSILQKAFTGELTNKVTEGAAA